MSMCGVNSTSLCQCACVLLNKMFILNIYLVFCIWLYFLLSFPFFCFVLHCIVASIASEYSADGSTFSRSGERRWTPYWNGSWRTVGTNFRVGQFLEDKTTAADDHEAFASACTTGGENMYRQVSIKKLDCFRCL
jgi:hypothetical protein